MRRLISGLMFIFIFLSINAGTVFASDVVTVYLSDYDHTEIQSAIKTECNAIPGEPVLEICDDGLDNDCDGYIDADDIEDCCMPIWILNETWSECAGNVQFKNFYDANDCGKTDTKPADVRRYCALGIGVYRDLPESADIGDEFTVTLTIDINELNKPKVYILYETIPEGFDIVNTGAMHYTPSTQTLRLMVFESAYYGTRIEDRVISYRLKYKTQHSGLFEGRVEYDKKSHIILGDNNITGTIEDCIPNWILNDTWSECIDGTQYRNYYDANDCGKPEEKPPDVVQSCKLHVPPIEVYRALPQSASMGEEFTVTLTVDVNEYNKPTVYILYETIPEGFDVINTGGMHYTASTRTLKLMVFESAYHRTRVEDRAIMYRLRPNAYPTDVFNGYVRYNYQNQETSGDCDGIVPEDEADDDNDGYRICEGDCNDTNDKVYPGAPELCDGLDNDCDNIVPDNETDSDSDGYRICDNDCNDTNNAIHPGADEVCDGVDNDCDLMVDEGFDADLDGYTTCAGDCNDTDPLIHPGVIEICDNKDNDCNGIVDDGYDADNDGYDNWYSSCGSDCDDSNPMIHPGADEVCDGIDNNCNNKTDEGVKLVFYRDSDGDSYGGTETAEACSVPEGYSVNSGDCDDLDATMSPNMSEICDGIDNDCDGEIDEDLTMFTYYEDSDGDSYGSTKSIEACTTPIGYVENPGDCDDADPANYPGADEVCDGIDNNCDGEIDEDVKSFFYNDRDGDGYGGAEVTLACSAPADHVENSDDCDDAKANTYPSATEICDGIDNDCDGEIDEGLTMLTLYRDADIDSYGSTESIEACTTPSGYVAVSGDCNDFDQFINPGAEEVCDDKDNDCDDEIDEGAGKTIFYQDSDGDGYGSTESTEACSAPIGYVSVSTDCNDTDADRHPGAKEVCDGIDNDCDGEIDEGLGDADNDGYSVCDGDCNDGNPSIHPGATEILCDTIDQDCDGSDSCPVRFKNRGDGTVLDIETGILWLRDANCIGPVYYEDTGKFGEGALTKVNNLGHGQCGLSDGSGPGNWRIPTLDEIKNLFRPAYCEDAGFSVPCLGNAAGTGRWQPGDAFIDVVVWDKDRPWNDPVQDYYWTSSNFDSWCKKWTVKFNMWTINYYPPIIPSKDFIRLENYLISGKGRWHIGLDDGHPYCNNMASGWVWPVRDTLVDNDGDGHYKGPDCDDTNPAINPDAEEVCDGIDNNCDSQIDETCDYDSDGYSPEEGDCDDTDQYINPGATEICDDKDNDCDSQIDEGVKLTFYRDSDNDSYGSTAGIQACSAPEGYVANSGDCDDTNPNIHPGAADPCDGIDNNCDGVPEERNYYFRDRDNDTYGALEIIRACSQPEGYVTRLGDCDDSNPDINPDGTEVCDNKDNDCDGIIDEGVRLTFYRDIDRDGYGSTSSISTCAARPGYVANSEDCDDDDWAVHPGSVEGCDGIDNDCDGEIDEPEGLVCRFEDQGDGTILDTDTGLYWLKNAGCIGGGLMFYDSAINRVNNLDDGQCSLSDNSWPGAWRLPSIEENMALCGYCGFFCYLSNTAGIGPWSEGDPFSNVKKGEYEAYWTSTPYSGTSQKLFRILNFGGCTDHFSMSRNWIGYYSFYTWPVRAALVDNDGDGFLVLESTDEGPDCDDSDPAVNPNATEICNHIDDNCVDGIDEVCDWDLDGYTPDMGDCDDTDDAVYPYQIEQSNGIDDNCDGKIDERFSIMGDGTVRDNTNGYRWLQDVTAIPPSTWSDAREIVSGLKNGMYGLSDGSQPGDWQLPTRVELTTLVDFAYAYPAGTGGDCEVLSLPYYYRKSWLDVPLGPALSNSQGDSHWREGDPFFHVDDINPECSNTVQNLCQHMWIGGGIILPWGECFGQPYRCNRNLFWTQETMGAYRGLGFDDSELKLTRECRKCTSVWGNEVFGYYKLPWEDPGGTCCIAFEMNRGTLDEFYHGYSCTDKLKVWPLKKG